MANPHAVVDPKLCVKCGECGSVNKRACPWEAITGPIGVVPTIDRNKCQPHCAGGLMPSCLPRCFWHAIVIEGR